MNYHKKEPLIKIYSPFVEIENPFMQYVKAKKLGNLKEAKRISDIIDNNADIAHNYINIVSSAYENKPNMKKFSFDDYIKTMKIEEK
jgi:hypothetical protein